MTVDMDLFAQLLEIRIGVAQAENEQAFELMQGVLPLRIHTYPSGREHNGWIVPHDWRVRRASIERDGEVLFDGAVHPMAVAGYSSSFQGTVSKSELDEHVFYRDDFPHAFVFNPVNNYRPWKRNWGFCIPYSTYATWGPGEYEVNLDVDFVEGQMLVGEYLHEGSSTETIVFNAHTCHPMQANDDLSGVVVLLALFDWLRGHKTRYSYLVVLAPEHLGTVFYLADRTQEELERLHMGCFVEMVGSTGPLVLQQSFTGRAAIDRVAEHVLRGVEPQLHVGAFRTVVGNDETVWEAPGIELPTISVSRWPYPEYHTSDDNLSIMSRERLDEALDALKATIRVFEDDRVIERRFTGLPALANPKYDLYVERWDPVVDKRLTEEQVQLGALQDSLLRYFDGAHSVFEIAERVGIQFDVMRPHIQRFEDKGLVELREPSSLEYYSRPKDSTSS
jgi:aminopeptidase-like protein